MQVASPYRCGSLAEQETQARELLKGAVTQDCEHLEGLMPSCAATADVLLCASDGASLIGFPVHSDYISLHSPVISGLLEVLENSKATTCTLHSRSFAYLCSITNIACTAPPHYMQL